MPRFEFIRKGIVPYMRPVPTETALSVLPMTLEGVGKEVSDEDAQPKRVESVADAFEQFKPSVNFKTLAGPEATEFVVELEPRSLKDFEPDNVQKRTPGKRNDIADLRNTIDLLYRLKERWSLPPVKRAWNDPGQRQQILAALSRLRTELEKVAHQPKGGK
jgi:type VI secretion system protein ImpB